MKPKLFYIGQAVMVDPDCHFVGEDHDSPDPSPDVTYHVQEYKAHPSLPRWMITLIEIPHNGEYQTGFDEAGFVPVDGLSEAMLAELVEETEPYFA